MTDPLDTAELLAFTKTVDAKSLSRAAVELGVPRATVGRRLARLEERLGVRLLRRTTRSLRMTDAGEAFYRHARIVLDAAFQAEQSVRRADSTIRGDLRVSLPPITDPGFHEMLCDFIALHPRVKLHAHFSTQHVDLVRDGYDVALRASTELEPGLVARTIARAPMTAVASPAYLAEKGAPRSVRDLKHHRCLMGFVRGELPQSHWPRKNGRRVHVEGSFFSNEITLLRAAALRGLGIAMLPELAIEDELARGELVPVLPGVLGIESRVSLVYREREFVPPPVRAFIDAFATWVPRQIRTPAARAQHTQGALQPSRARHTQGATEQSASPQSASEQSRARNTPTAAEAAPKRKRRAPRGKRQPKR